MDFQEDEELGEKLFLSEKEKERLKQQVLEEDFKKALKPKKANVKELKAVSKIKDKRKFAKFGIGIIIIAVICVAFINTAPWMYVKFDSNLEDKTLEFAYSKNFGVHGNNESPEVLAYFYNDNSSRHLGVTPNDFSTTAKNASYVLYALVCLGIIFTIFEIIMRKRKLAYEKSIIIYTAFSAITAVLCVYLLYISVKFFSVHFLLYHNIEYINPSLPNLVILFIAPVFLIFMSAGLLKISFTTMKINFNLCEKLCEEKRPKKSLYHFKKEGAKR